jgi:hypothetical protein
VTSSIIIRVTILGEFSPFGPLFTLDFLNYKSCPNVSATFFLRQKLCTHTCTNFDQKMGSVTFWAISSQTHLVTLTYNTIGVHKSCLCACIRLPMHMVAAEPSAVFAYGSVAGRNFAFRVH